MRHAVSELESGGARASRAVDLMAPSAGGTGRGVQLRLICLVRAGDGYVVSATGRPAVGGVPARGGATAQLDGTVQVDGTVHVDGTAQVDISFGDAGDRRAAADLHLAVQHIQRWCELGTAVALLYTGSGVTLCGEDGTAVTLPRCAA
jgi:hypothetical protein